MAHDMRGILAVLTTTSDMLVRGMYGELTPQQSRASERIQRNSSLLVNLLDDLIIFVKADANQLPLNPLPFDPRMLLAEIQKQTSPFAESKGLKLHWTVVSDLPETLVGDASLIRRIMSALLWNALGFTDAGDVWMDSSWTTEQQWVTTVRDSGPGVPAGDELKIFHPFYRGEKRPQMPTPGFGLGLSMASRVAHLMHGRVTLEQTGPSGSTFCLRLPLLIAKSPLVP